MKKTIIIIILSCCYEVLFSQWQQTNLSSGNIHCLAVDSNTIYAGGSEGLWKSNNSGTTWTSQNNGLIHPEIYSICLRDTCLFAGLVDESSGIYFSNFDFNLWTKVVNGLPWNFSVPCMVANDINIYAGTGNNGIYKSSDNGINWIAINNGIGYPYISSVAIKDTILFAGSNNNNSHGLYTANINNEQWTLLDSAPDLLISSILIYDDYIFIGAYGGIFLSTNNGDSWVSVKNEISCLFIYSLTKFGSFIFAGTNCGVWMSSNQGINWQSLNDGLVNMNITALNNNGIYLYAGTNANGVWRRELQEIISINEVKQNNSVQVFPNPCKNTIKIIDNSAKIESVKIFDIYGNVQIQLTENLYEIDLSALKPGIYFIMIKSLTTYITKVIIN
jgi:hypothetical protein